MIFVQYFPRVYSGQSIAVYPFLCCLFVLHFHQFARKNLEDSAIIWGRNFLWGKRWILFDNNKMFWFRLWIEGLCGWILELFQLANDLVSKFRISSKHWNANVIIHVGNKGLKLTLRLVMIEQLSRHQRNTSPTIDSINWYYCINIQVEKCYFLHMENHHLVLRFVV